MAGLRDPLSRLKEGALGLAVATPFYALTLGGKAPTALSMAPHDPWPGDADAGAAVLAGRFRLAGETHAPAEEGRWEPDDASPGFVAALNAFEFLRDLRALGGDQARREARALVASWIADPPPWTGPAWTPHATGARIASWIGQHEFFIASAEDGFRARVFDSLARQARHLARTAGADRAGGLSVAAAKGLACAGLCLPGHEKAADAAVRLLDRELPRQILPDGVHASRSPHRHLRVLRDLIDIRALLRQARRPVPDALQAAVERMAPALRFFRHGDGGLALFHGADEDVPVLIDTVLAQADARGRPVKSAVHAGFERVLCGRTLAILDAGPPPPPGLDADAHAGTLSFEMSVGRERLIVNCGSVPGAAGDLRRMLAATAAHSTVTLGDRNSAEVLEAGGLGRRPEEAAATRSEADGAVLVEAVHDGYLAAFGTRHRRSLYVAADGEDVRGEDRLEGPGGHPFAVRFHLHPGVQASLIQNGSAVLLRLPSGSGWRMRASGAAIALADSLYAGGPGPPRRTQQIVLSGTTAEGGTVVKWALRREKREG
jgi:uncharacterized heparinase superfamily protein